VDSIAITGVSIIFPGVTNLREFKSFLNRSDYDIKNEELSIPSSELLPARMKRRMSPLTQMTIQSTSEARMNLDLPNTVPFIFGSANGEINTIGRVMQSILDPEDMVSPTLFHNSVHNTAPGYWSIVSGLRDPSNTVSGGVLTTEYTLLDAWIKMQSGIDCMQITIGDESVRFPRWADPSHCSVDLCGSFVLDRRGILPPLLELLSIRYISGSKNILNCHREMNDMFKPVMVLTDLDTLPSTQEIPFFPNHHHPCATLFPLIMFVFDDNVTGPILFIRKGIDDDACFTLIRKPHHVSK
jgi:Beta-ketoacyl synthase, N-terminal domain